jgi:hypothetical protein
METGVFRIKEAAKRFLKVESEAHEKSAEIILAAGIQSPSKRCHARKRWRVFGILLGRL